MTTLYYTASNADLAADFERQILGEGGDRLTLLDAPYPMRSVLDYGPGTVVFAVTFAADTPRLVSARDLGPEWRPATRRYELEALAVGLFADVERSEG